MRENIRSRRPTGPWLQQLRDLDSVQRGAFQELVSGNPEGKAILERAIAPNAPNLAVVLAGGEKWHWIAVTLGFVDQLQTGCLGENLMRLFDRNGPLELRAHSDGMSTVNRDAHAGD